MAIKRFKDLNFPLYGDVAEMIDQLVDEIENSGPFIDCMMDELHGSARDLDPEDEKWVHRYYLQGGWRADGRFHHLSG